MGVRTLYYVRHLDVGFSYPDAVEGIKGPTVLRVKRNMSWVHTVVRQVGFYLLRDMEKCDATLVREDQVV